MEMSLRMGRAHFASWRAEIVSTNYIPRLVRLLKCGLRAQAAQVHTRHTCR